MSSVPDAMERVGPSGIAVWWVRSLELFPGVVLAILGFMPLGPSAAASLFVAVSALGAGELLLRVPHIEIHADTVVIRWVFFRREVERRCIDQVSMQPGFVGHYWAYNLTLLTGEEAITYRWISCSRTEIGIPWVEPSPSQRCGDRLERIRKAILEPGSRVDPLS